MASSAVYTTSEYQVIISHNVDLQLAFESNLTFLCTELLDAEFITPNQYDDIARTSQRPVRDRAADLVRYVQIKVCANSQYYYTFIDVLKKDETEYRDILAKLENMRSQLVSRSREDGDPQPTPGAVPTVDQVAQLQSQLLFEQKEWEVLKQQHTEAIEHMELKQEEWMTQLKTEILKELKALKQQHTEAIEQMELKQEERVTQLEREMQKHYEQVNQNLSSTLEELEQQHTEMTKDMTQLKGQVTQLHSDMSSTPEELKALKQQPEMSSEDILPQQLVPSGPRVYSQVGSSASASV